MERKEAIEIIKKNWPDSSFTMLREALETLIPELKENEDEKIRKALIYFIKQGKIKGTIRTYLGVAEEDMLAWLEKQAEQNPAWSKEDETLLNCCLGAINTTDYFDKDNKDKMKDWLESLKDRVQPKQEWNYNDEIIIGTIIQEIEKIPSEKFIDNAKYRCLDWLRYRIKFFKPQLQWKPNDKQMEVMGYLAKYYAVGIDEPNRSIIISLYEDLQKLMRK